MPMGQAPVEARVPALFRDRMEAPTQPFPEGADMENLTAQVVALEQLLFAVIQALPKSTRAQIDANFEVAKEAAPTSLLNSSATDSQREQLEAQLARLAAGLATCMRIG